MDYSTQVQVFRGYIIIEIIYFLNWREAYKSVLRREAREVERSQASGNL